MRRIILVLLSMVFLKYMLGLSFCCCAFASIEEGLPLTPVPYDEEMDLYRRAAVKSDSDVVVDETITSFDFSEDMGLVLLTSGSHLIFMDQNGAAERSLSFNWPGTAGVAWEGTDVCLFFTRGNLVMKISADGALKGMYRLDRLDYDTQKQWDSFAFRTQMETESGVFTLTKNGAFRLLFGDEYTTLVFRDRTTGREETLYDASTAANWKYVVLLFLGVTIVLMILLVVRAQRREKRNQSGDGSNVIKPAFNTARKE